MHLSESGQAFQAVSHSFSLLKQSNGNGPQGVGQVASQAVQNRYTLRTTEFQGKFPQEGYNGQMNCAPQAAPEFIKNVSASAQPYGVTVGNSSTVPPTAVGDKAASIEKTQYHQVYSTP